MLQLTLPTLRDVHDAPERSVLSVLEACATNAEHILLSRNPDTADFVALVRRAPAESSPSQMIASRQLLRVIYDLRDAITLYEATLCASNSDQHDGHDDEPFFPF